MGEKQQYVDALCSELRGRCAEQPHPLRTVYFGGGTPTILSIAQLSAIVDTIRAHFDTSQLQEATIEANPEDLTPQFLSDLRSLHFFNRVSIGIQSFHDDDLRVLNRRHNAAQTQAAVINARQAGFDNISIDLIYGLPGQDLEAWRHNLRQLESLPVSHFSAYSLTVEDGTMLQRQIELGKIVPASEQMALQHYYALLSWAAAQGFEQYEISNFCKPGMQSRHNSRYWDRTPYLGVGAAAHSFDGRCRRWNVADVQRYISNQEYDTEALSPTDAFNEYVMTALRTTAGINKQMIPAEYQSYLQKAIGRFVAHKLIEDTPTHYRPTREGLLHADGMSAALFHD